MDYHPNSFVRTYVAYKVHGIERDSRICWWLFGCMLYSRSSSKQFWSCHWNFFKDMYAKKWVISLNITFSIFHIYPKNFKAPFLDGNRPFLLVVSKYLPCLKYRLYFIFLTSLHRQYRWEYTYARAQNESRWFCVNKYKVMRCHVILDLEWVRYNTFIWCFTKYIGLGILVVYYL